MSNIPEGDSDEGWESTPSWKPATVDGTQHQTDGTTADSSDDKLWDQHQDGGLSTRVGSWMYR